MPLTNTETEEIKAAAEKMFQGNSTIIMDLRHGYISGATEATIKEKEKAKVTLLGLKKWIQEQKGTSQRGYVDAKDEEARTMYGSENAALGIVEMKIDKILSVK